MSSLVWDKAGDRKYETGVDHGVLHLLDSTPIPWNGLTQVAENENRTSKQYYLDGRVFINTQTPGNFAGTLQAFTYPDEFDDLIGNTEFIPGVYLKDQNAKPFNLSYRTYVFSDTDDSLSRYKLHILFNILASPSDSTYESLAAETTPMQLEWTLSSAPGNITSGRPTAHVVIDSGKVDPVIFAEIEEILYGTDTTPASLTDLPTFLTSIENINAIIITDNGDGTWSANGPDANVTMLDSETFQITDVDATFSDADTYTVTTTVLDS